MHIKSLLLVTMPLSPFDAWVIICYYIMLLTPWLFQGQSPLQFNLSVPVELEATYYANCEPVYFVNKCLSVPAVDLGSSLTAHSGGFLFC